MTLKEFRSNPSLLEYARGLFATPEFQKLMDAMRNEHPKNFRDTMRGMTEQDHSLRLGRIFGYDEFENNLMSAATAELPQETLHATFTPPVEDKE